MKTGCLLIVVALFVNGCGTSRSVPGSTIYVDTDVVLLGVVQKSGLKAPVSASAMAADLDRIIAGLGGVAVTSATDTRQIIGASPHDEMLAFYARHGRFAPYQVQRLMAANLPAGKALAVRLESDTVERLPVLRQNLVDQRNRVIADRERQTYVTRRVTQMSASLLDLYNGRTIWTRQYRVSPQSGAAFDLRAGDTFGQSVAAAVENTLLKDLRDADYPAPPPLANSVLALLEKVARNAPLR